MQAAWTITPVKEAELPVTFRLKNVFTGVLASEMVLLEPVIVIVIRAEFGPEVPRDGRARCVSEAGSVPSSLLPCYLF